MKPSSSRMQRRPDCEHIGQLGVSAHWIPKALQADAEDVVKISGKHGWPTNKPKSGDGDTFAAVPFRLKFRQQRCGCKDHWQVFRFLSLSLAMSDDGTARVEWTADTPTKMRDVRRFEKTE